MSNDLKHNLLTLAKLTVEYLQLQCRWCDIYRVLKVMCIAVNITTTLQLSSPNLFGDEVAKSILMFIRNQAIIAAFETMTNHKLIPKGQKLLMLNLSSDNCPKIGQLIDMDKGPHVSGADSTKIEVFIRFLFCAIDYVVTKPSETVIVMAVKVLQALMRLLASVGHGKSINVRWWW